ncbi:unnamed protein product, partial [Mesorhabditis belari]|uniref:BPTI/Kunitz inhibitor domain-containing protein n=1 Tax=Mesorhabditis belari TaxID=2138241 RepID=A0AAF3FRU2_9BILA
MPLRSIDIRISIFFISIFLIDLTIAKLPDDLDKFLEKLFETEECEEWVSDSTFVSVSTRDCSPHQCDFPSEICMRPAAKYQDKKANQCRKLPAKCVTAANGGVPVGPPPTDPPPLFTFPPPLFTLPTLSPPDKNSTIFRPYFPLIPQTSKGTPAPVNVRPRDICEMGPPTGRFCGFAQKFVYNKETFECDEFWFPGCKTEETNANLFDSRKDCERVADLCVQIEEMKAARLTTPRPHPRKIVQPRGPDGIDGFPKPRNLNGKRKGPDGLLAQELKQGGNAALPKVAAQQAQTWLSQFGFPGIPDFFGGGEGGPPQGPARRRFWNF